MLFGIAYELIGRNAAVGRLCTARSYEAAGNYGLLYELLCVVVAPVRASLVWPGELLLLFPGTNSRPTTCTLYRGIENTIPAVLYCYVLQL